MPVKIKAIMCSMTPIRTATPPPGEDTIWRGFRVTIHGKVIVEIIKPYHCKVHEGKKNGGPSYTAYDEMEVIIQNHHAQDDLNISYIVVNIAHGTTDIVGAMITAFEQRTKDGVGLVPLPQNEKVKQPMHFEANLLSLATTALGLVGNILGKRIGDLLTNQDGPVAFKTVTLKPAELVEHEQIELGCSCAGLTGRSHYVIDCKLFRLPYEAA